MSELLIFSLSLNLILIALFMYMVKCRPGFCLCQTYGDADRLLKYLKQVCEKTGYLSVYELYAINGINPREGLKHYGWSMDQLNEAKIYKCRSGWYIWFPTADFLKEDKKDE